MSMKGIRKPKKLLGHVKGLCGSEDSLSPEPGMVVGLKQVPKVG